MRLNKIIAELNIASERAIEFLSLNNCLKNFNSSTKLTEYEIELLRKKFGGEIRNKEINLKDINSNKVLINFELLEYQELNSDISGIDFDLLFGKYFLNAEKIFIQDPYIRLEHQIRNLIELLHTLLRKSKKLKTVKILTGYDDSEQLNNNNDTFKEFSKIAKSKFKFNFEYDFDKNIHDRKITINDTIIIFIGRGLDIYNNVQKESHNNYKDLKLKNSFVIILKENKYTSLNII
jgi:hypothetical protein